MKRKIIIVVAVLFVTAAGFYGYIRLTGSTAIRLPERPSGEKPTDQWPSQQPGQVGQTVIHAVQQSRYTVLDPVTKKIKRVLGFSKLLNPGAQSSYWQLEQPYMEVYEDRYRCRIEANEGTVQVERAGDSVIPKDASLSGKVVIRLLPEPSSGRFAPADIYLDQVSYSSERSEFSTDGAVRLLSSQAKLDGKGMLLIYNPATGRIEYFQIRELAGLRLKNFVHSSLFSSPPAGDAPAQTAGQTDTDTESFAAEPNQPVPLKQGAYYRCSLNDDVVIHYGRQLIVEGAEQVNITNLFWGGSSRSDSGGAGGASAEGQDVSAPDDAQLRWDGPADIPPDDDASDIFIKCGGGIIVEPIEGLFREDQQAGASALSVNMTGSPLQIFRLEPAMSDKPLPLVSCRDLHYLPGQEVLNLYAVEPYVISLYFGDGENSLETFGSVLWDRKAQQAFVSGPGTIRFHTNTAGRESKASEMNFLGGMELLFAQGPDLSTASLQLKAVNLAGGMSAALQGKNLLYTQAQTASFEFASSSRLSCADLSGDVHLQTDTDNPSQALADAARFNFGQDAELLNAELNGNVRFQSVGRSLSSDSATVTFAADAGGNIVPAAFSTSDQTVLQTAMTDKDSRPARFQARSLDYNLADGTAVAKGPVSFCFFVPADPNGTKSAPSQVLITARDDAQFVAGPKGAIEQVVFGGDVVCDASVENGGQNHVRKIFGDKLTVKLAGDSSGRNRVSHIAVTGEKVLLREMLLSGDQKLNHIELTCLRLDYSDAERTVTASGPGKIELNNQQTPAGLPASSPDALDLRKPCYALLEGFDRLIWTVSDRSILAEGKTDSINLSYVAMIDGKPGSPIYAAVSKAFLTFAASEQGKTSLQSLKAENGVYLEHRDHHTLVGQTLGYQGRDAMLIIEGTEERPCLVDGARVPAIEYNLLTGKLKTRLSAAPGAVPVR